MVKDTTSLLLCVATVAEAQPLLERLDLTRVSSHVWKGRHKRYHMTLLVTGVGMVNTTWELGQYLANHLPDVALNFGIAGSFQRSIALGQVVEIREDIFSELGAAAPEGWLGLEQLGFPLFQEGETPIHNRLFNPHAPLDQWLKVRGLTVNTVHGTQPEIDAIVARWRPSIETMEGAAFFYAMRRMRVPFHALRGISNYVEPRNRSAWQIGPAIAAVNAATLHLLASEAI